MSRIMGLFDRFKRVDMTAVKAEAVKPFYKNYYGDIIRVQGVYGKYQGVFANAGTEDKLPPRDTYEQAEADLRNYAKMERMIELTEAEKIEFLTKKRESGTLGL